MEIFGVVNASPDSLAGFSVVSDETQAKQYGAHLVAEGADHLDVGAQASHGNAAFVNADEEWQIVEGPLQGLLSLGVDVAIDTWQVETARRALDAGARVLNAADALQSDEMIALAAEREIQVVLPFMLGPDPRHLKHVEGDLVQVMVDWFDLQLERAARWGIRERLMLDPGTGFAPAHWDWDDRFEYQKRIYGGLDRLRHYELPLYVPIAWKQTPDRLELVDLVLAQEVEYVRAHIPLQVRQRHAAIRDGTPLPTSDLWSGYE